MMKIGKNKFVQWELLLKVLTGEIPETDQTFLRWLEEDEANKTLYSGLSGKGQKGSSFYDKDEAFTNISNKLGLSLQKKVPFYRKIGFKYVASILLFVSVGLGIVFLMAEKEVRGPKIARIKKNVFDPGSKKAYLLSSQGETIDLSETFELKNNDGTIVSNKSEGVLSFKKSLSVNDSVIIKDKEPVNKSDSEKRVVEQQTIYVPKGGEYELLLADGSRVYLNSETKLVFPSYFEGETRQVELMGEAYFEVKKDHKPFIVKTVDMQIEVLGTTFNVNAYQNNLLVNTTLVEGSVQIHIPDNPRKYLLTPENNLSINKSSNEISIQKVNTDLYTAWVKGEFVFRNQTLRDIFSQLVRWYDFEIEYENQAIQTMRFSGSIEKARPLNSLLNQIQSVTDVKYRKEGDKIILY